MSYKNKVNFISNTMLFNFIHRDEKERHNKYQFLLYDFSRQCEDWYHCIHLTNHMEFFLQNPDFTLQDIKNHIEMNEHQLFKNRKRIFNILIPNFKNQWFLEQVRQMSKTKLDGQGENMDDDLFWWNTAEYQQAFKDKFEDMDVEGDEELKKDIMTFSVILKIYNFLKQERVTELYVLLDDFQEFMCRNNFMKNFFNKLTHKQSEILPYPNMIIPDKLYLGNEFQSQNKEILQNLGITHIINMTKDVKNAFQEDDQFSIQYLQNPLDDQSEDNIQQYFQSTFKHLNEIFGFKYHDTMQTFSQIEQQQIQEIIRKTSQDMDPNLIVQTLENQQKKPKVQFVDPPSSKSITDGSDDKLQSPLQDQPEEEQKTQISPAKSKLSRKSTLDDEMSDSYAPRHKSVSVCNDKKVLIHCVQGISRSATIVIMFIMKINKWTYEQAYQYVKERRFCIDPNPGFQQTLVEFQENNWKFKYEK